MKVRVEKQPNYEYKPNKNKFEGESSYKSTFVQKNNPDVQSQDFSSLKQQYMNNRVKVPFEGHSSYKDTFKNPGVKVERQP